MVRERAGAERRGNQASGIGKVSQDGASNTVSSSQLRQVAVQHHRAGRIEQAVALYQHYLAARPDDAGAWTNLGAALRKQKHFQSAVNCYRRALAIEPGDLATLGNLANALKDLHRLDESLAIHRQVVAQKPDDIQSLVNHACALREDGRFEDALQQLERAGALDEALSAASSSHPKFVSQRAAIEWERSQNLLYLGRYTEGWQAYEARWRTGDLPRVEFGCPQWRGEDIAGKTLLLHAEQGYGDTILAARFVAALKARVGREGRVILQCKAELHRLFLTIGADLLQSPVPALDYHCPLMSLMGLLDIQPSTIPAPAPLHVPAAARAKFKNLQSQRVFRIGIVWSGSITFKNNDNRALPLSAFLPLAELPGVRLYSLQKGPRQTELRDNGATAYIEDLGARCDDFADTAAAIEQLDCIVMTDSSVAHLAASLGKPVINLLEKVPYWLYTLGQETTPWYPTMRLCRQEAHGDWTAVFERTRSHIQTLQTSRNVAANDSEKSS
jgi:tetratricopeptide (TPR) repeat protein